MVVVTSPSLSLKDGDRTSVAPQCSWGVAGAAGVLNGPGSRLEQTGGERWARALTGLDRGQGCYTWAERLAKRSESPQVRLEGVRMALAAMREWRAGAGMNIGDFDAEMRADEMLRAAIATRQKIAG